jgi:hypothetical protein
MSLIISVVIQLSKIAGSESYVYATGISSDPKIKREIYLPARKTARPL